MELRKILLVVVAALFLATPALAGNEPEFDTVGFDGDNVFNDDIKCLVTEKNLDGYGQPINYLSFWRAGLMVPLPNDNLVPFFNVAGNDYWGELFTTGVEEVSFPLVPPVCYPDPCFGRYVEWHGMEPWRNSTECGFLTEPYESVLTPVTALEYYHWWIILQMKPESDIDLNIRDCVLKDNAAWEAHALGLDLENAIWFFAEQTGRYRSDEGKLMFMPSFNPKITVEANPGPYATFVHPFYLDARTLPGLFPTTMKDACYTSKALWEEGLVMELPKSGCTNTLGQPTGFLKQGDQIRIKIEIPWGHPADVYYGPENVSLKYVGICGTEFTTNVFPNCPDGNLGYPGCNVDDFCNFHLPY